MGSSIEFSVNLWREGEMVIAHAMPLDVTSAGSTPEDARRALDEAVGLFLSTARDHGTLEEVLLDCGYARSGETWQGPAWIGMELHALSVAA
jgi:predicted RNase H-like HicB family nuclease